MPTKKETVPVLVTTQYRGVFFGYTDDETANPIILKNARCAIRWNTTGGFLELGELGPNSGSLIGNRAPQIILYGVTSVSHVTPKAVEKWEKA